MSRNLSLMMTMSWKVTSLAFGGVISNNCRSVTTERVFTAIPFFHLILSGHWNWDNWTGEDEEGYEEEEEYEAEEGQYEPTCDDPDFIVRTLLRICSYDFS